MYKKTCIIFIVFLLFVSNFFVFPQTEPPAGWHQLQTVQIFSDTQPGGWSGSGDDSLEVTDDSYLPLDTDVTYNDLPSLRVNVTANSSWWLSLITIAGWTGYDVSQYYDNGYLEFNIKGDAGSERILIGLRDRVYERYDDNGDVLESVDQMAATADYVTVSTEWQHAAIPLKDIIDTSSVFDQTQVICIVLDGDTSDAVKLWLNDIKFTSADNEDSFPAIKINQAGYTKQSHKYALVSQFYDELSVAEGMEFQVRNAVNDALVYSGTLGLRSGFDEISGEVVFIADFTDVTDEGTYYISIPGSDAADSLTFDISDTVYDEVLIDSMRYFYYQRANMDLVAPYCPDYPHPAWHLDDLDCHLESYYMGLTLDVSQGWYDAGDFGKYINAAACAVQDLLWTYEMFPEVFADDQFNIPESGNGLPDILDEIAYELYYMLGSQDPESGGFYHRVLPGDADVTLERYVEDIDDEGNENHRPTAPSADAAAALAHAYLIFKDFDTDLAEELLTAAINGWSYLEAVPEMVETSSGAYEDSEDLSNRLWAAAALYRATGEAKYNDYFLANYQDFAETFDSPHVGHLWGQMEIPAFFMYLASDSPDTEVVDWFTEKFTYWRSAQNEKINTIPFHNSLEEGDYWWGSNDPALATGMDMVIGSKLLGIFDKDDIEASKSNLYYILGINPMRKCMLSGYGQDSVENVYSNIYNYDDLEGIPAGYMPGGPNKFQNQYASNFAAKCYIDSNTDWTSNEHTIYWNSVFVFNAALGIAEKAIDPEVNDKYVLTVNGGTGSGNYEEGQIVNVNWVSPTTYPGSIVVFYEWEGDIAYLADQYSPSTTLTMPAEDITITAVFEVINNKLYDLTVIGGMGTGSYAQGNFINITGIPPVVEEGYEAVFIEWTGDTEYIVDSSLEAAVITMPDADISVEAVYEIVEIPADVIVEYIIQSQWSTGATILLKIMNESTEIINGWTINFTFPGNQQITNAWCCEMTQTGSDVEISNLSWNKIINPGQTVEIGFNISFSGTNDILDNIEIITGN